MLKDNSQLKRSLSPYQGIYDAIIPANLKQESKMLTLKKTPTQKMEVLVPLKIQGFTAVK